MGILNSNLVQFNITSEAELSNILANFNEDMIYNIVQDNINQRFNHYQLSLPNLVASYENNFKNLKIQYPGQSEAIDATRYDVYTNIIQILCRNFNISFMSQLDENIDLYSIAYILYKFLISDFRSNVVSFFVNFIIKEKNSIYESMNLNDRKKNKDSSTAYNKKTFKNVKLAVITANLEYVIQSICLMDIPFDIIVNTIYMYDKNISKTLLSLIAPNSNFFRDNIVTMMYSNISSIILTDIRLSIHSMSVDTESINNII